MDMLFACCGEGAHAKVRFDFIVRWPGHTSCCYFCLIVWYLNVNSLSQFVCLNFNTHTNNCIYYYSVKYVVLEVKSEQGALFGLDFIWNVGDEHERQNIATRGQTHNLHVMTVNAS